jgi:hypothetical protein
MGDGVSIAIKGILNATITSKTTVLYQITLATIF